VLVALAGSEVLILGKLEQDCHVHPLSMLSQHIFAAFGQQIASTLWPCEKSSLRHMRYRPSDSVGEERLLAARQHHQPIFIGDIQCGSDFVPDLCSRSRFISLNCHQDGAHHRLEVGYRHEVDSSHWLG
jgi:hypothetical protein